MRQRTRWVTGTALAAALAMLAGLSLVPAQAEESPAAGEKNVLTVGITQDVDSTNPFTGIAAASFEAYQMMYPTLTE